MRSLLPLLALLAAALPGQSYYYSPDNNATTGSSNVIPFGNGTTGTWENQRAQFLFRAANLPGKPGLIRSIGFAPSGTGTYQFKAIVIRLGHNTTGTLVNTGFMANYATPPQTVFNVYNVSWPVVAATWCRFPLSRPFIYNGTDNVTVDVAAIGSHLNTKSGFRTGADPRAYKTAMTLAGDLKPFGLGCVGSNAKTPTADLLCMPLVGAQIFDVGVKDAPASGAAILLGGVSNTLFASLPLPLDLGFFGAKGCNLYTSIEFIGGALADPLGAALVPLAIPYDPTFHKVSVFFQWLLPDAAANPLGMITSDGLEAVLDLYEYAPLSAGSSSGLKMEFEIL